MDDANCIAEKSLNLLEVLQETNGDSDNTNKLMEYIDEQISSKSLCPLSVLTDCEWPNLDVKPNLQKDLDGRLVILDFFTYCCINCLHILPQLQKIEEKFREQVLIVGVHSAKFDNEKNSKNIVDAVKRYKIQHPVVNDKDAQLWQILQVQCWPTLLVLGPKQEMLLMLMGETHEKTLNNFLEIAIKYFTDLGQLFSTNRIEAHLNSNMLSSTQISTDLNYPGKVAISPCGLKLAICDAGNNRILITDRNGLVQAVIGGHCSSADGSFPDAGFHSPQGVCWDPSGDKVYVADTENHLIREVDLSKQFVLTVAGRGYQGNDIEGGHSAQEQEISSPWDVTCLLTEGEDTAAAGLLIAMAGTHQIWLLCLSDVKWLGKHNYNKGTCVRVAGSGAEENRNNSYPYRAAFAQPSGICLGNQLKKGKWEACIFVADSESSSIRAVSLVDGSVTAVVGGDRDPKNLFAYGDEDGTGFSAKLQHPLGVAFNGKKDTPTLYVADSYNHKIKVVDLSSKLCSSLDLPLNEDGTRKLNEPGGLAVSPDGTKVLIANTNNHDIQVFDLQMSTMTRVDVAFTTSDSSDGSSRPASTIKHLVPHTTPHDVHPSVTVGMNVSCSLELIVKLSDNLHLNTEAPNKVLVLMSGPAASKRCRQENLLKVDQFPVILPFTTTPDDKSLTVECILFVCDDGGLCMIRNKHVTIPLMVEEGCAQTHLQLVLDITE